MLQCMIESSNDETEVSFNQVIDEDKYYAIANEITNLTKKIGNGFFEPLGVGFIAKSNKYTVVMIGEIIRINYYEDPKNVIFQYIEINLEEGIAINNIKTWPSDLVQIYQKILNIANS